MTRKKENLLQNAKHVLHLSITKAGKHLPKNRKAIVALAKEELRLLFGKN